MVQVSFSGRTLSCVGEPITKEGRVILNSLRLGNVIAHEFVSLDPSVANQWTLKSSENIPTREATEQKTQYKSFMHHPNFPKNIFESIRDREPIFFLSSSKEADQNSMTIGSLTHMLMVMNAAIRMSCRDRYQEASYDFLLVPHEMNASKVMGVACVWSNFPIVQIEKRVISSTQEHIMECHSNGQYSKKVRTHSEKETQHILNENCSTQNNDTVKPFTWKELVEVYDLCVSQRDGAPLPIEFARKKLFAAVVTLWNGEISTNAKLEKLGTLFDLLRCSNPNVNDISILSTNNELSHAIKTRHRVGDHPNRFVTLILMQILIRIQLLSMHNDNDNERNGFLDMYSRVNCKNACTKVSTKKKKKSKIYTLDSFTSELRSLAEMLPFTLPSPSMFSSFLSQEVLKPYQVVIPSLMTSLSEYFELDLSEQTEDSIETDERESNQSQLISNDVNAKSKQLNPRWSKSIPQKMMESSECQEPRQKMLVPQETEEKILFENNFEVTVKTKINNPLLSDNKGRYVGRQFSGNYFREVKVFKPKLAMNVKTANKNRDTSSLFRSEECKRPCVSETPERRTNMTSILSRPSSSAGTMTLMTGKSGSRFGSTFNHAEELHTESSSSKAKHPHAAVMKALAVMRKRRR